MFRPLIIVAAASLVAGCSVFGIRSGLEQPSYEAVERLDESVEVRRYASRVAAEASVEAEDTEDGRNAAFRLLFDYITGANRGEESIAMTAPVETASASEEIAMTAPVETVRDEAGRVRMRFFLPAEYADSPPAPTDPRVRIVMLPPETLAVLQFSGSRGEGAVTDKTRDLLSTIEASRWQVASDPVAQFYDPPWTLPFLRRNEVAVAVQPR